MGKNRILRLTLIDLTGCAIASHYIDYTKLGCTDFEKLPEDLP